MPNPVVHFEIGCQSSEAAQAFYASLFDWKTTPMGPAAMIDTGSSAGIPGHFTSLGHEPHHYILFYVDVDDIEAYLAKAVSLGGKIVVPKVDIPNGSFAWFSDIDGNTVGLWKAAQPPGV